MGNSGSTISDLFYPDNPKRRRRAEELKGDIYMLRSEFNYLKAQREATINRIRPQLDKLLHDQGFQSSSELERRVMEIVQGTELENYKRMKIELDLGDTAMSILWDIIGLVGAGTGVIIGFGYAFGMVTAAEALAAIGTVGAILGIATAVELVFGAVEGAVERQKLRNAIHELWQNRVDMKVEVERMRVINNWVDSIDTWLQFPKDTDPRMMNNLLAKTLNRDYKECTPNNAARSLKDLDNNRHSWTNEDPSDTTIPIVEEVPTAILELLPLQAFGTHIKKFTYQNILSAETCQVSDDTGIWELRAHVPDVRSLDLAMIQLDVQSLTRNELSLEQCTVRILETANH